MLTDGLCVCVSVLDTFPLHFQIHGQGLCSCFVLGLLVYDTIDYIFQICDISNISIHIGLELINTIVSNQQKHDRHTLPGRIYNKTNFNN